MLISQTEKSAELYGISHWGAGFFDVNQSGNLRVTIRDGQSATEPASVTVMAIVEELRRKGYTAPLLLRFPQIISSQVKRMHDSFTSAMQEFEYDGGHIAVYPMKVNPRRSVVEEYVKIGARYGFGLEAGSKAELYIALGMDQPPESPLIVNGFKDREFVELASLGTRAGKNVILVIEKLSELDHVIDLHRGGGAVSNLGARVKLYARGIGKWSQSGGEASKFGLTSTELLDVIRRLRVENLIDKFQLLHFHIGSQLTDIKRIKHAVKEAGRVYAKVAQMGVGIRFLDIGGGMAVDYDGSKSSFESSANYTPQEYANDVVFHLNAVCKQENVPTPTIITESGRVLTAHHAMMVINVQSEIETLVEEVAPFAPTGESSQPVTELKFLNDHINLKNHHEYYYDALEQRDELFTLFDLGLVSLEERAQGEVLFWDVCEKAERLAREVKYIPEDFIELRQRLAAKYLANFSLFQSMPDHWAFGQLFPVIPIHRLDEEPTIDATLCDITCDSDGTIDRFVDLHDVKKTLPVHELREAEPYYLAVLLTGAYQEVMGNQHNLLGAPHEAHIHLSDKGFQVKKIIPGHDLGQSVQWGRYEPEALAESFTRFVDRNDVARNPDQREDLVRAYKDFNKKYVYLTNE